MQLNKNNNFDNLIYLSVFIERTSAGDRFKDPLWSELGRRFDLYRASLLF